MCKIVISFWHRKCHFWYHWNLLITFEPFNDPLLSFWGRGGWSVLCKRLVQAPITPWSRVQCTMPRVYTMSNTNHRVGKSCRHHGGEWSVVQARVPSVPRVPREKKKRCAAGNTMEQTAVPNIQYNTSHSAHSTYRVGKRRQSHHGAEYKPQWRNRRNRHCPWVWRTMPN